MAEIWVNNQATGGSDDGSSEANGFLTIDQAMNWVTSAGTGPHTIWVKGGTNYNETFTIDTLITDFFGIIFEGYTSTTGDSGVVIVDGESTRPSGLTCLLSGNARYKFKNFEFTNHTGSGVDTTLTDSIVFENCTFSNNGGSGVTADNDIAFLRCVIDGNANGLDVDSGCMFVFCLFSNNTVWAINGSSASSLAYGCTFVDNWAGWYNGNGSANLVSCTFDGITSEDAFNTSPYIPSLAMNNIFTNCVTALDGITDPSFSYGLISESNLFYNNTTDYDNWPNTTGDITGVDPLFTDTGSTDYTLTVSSPARNAGADASGYSGNGMDIGAYQSTDAGSGTRIVMAG